MARFNAASSGGKNVYTVDAFKGVDLNSSGNNIDPARSPDAPNMIRDEVGTVRKRMGYYPIADYGECINGVHAYGNKKLIHAGTKLYLQEEGDKGIADALLLYSDMNNCRSTSLRYENNLFLLDGKKYLVYDGNNVLSPKLNAYVPTLLIGKNVGSAGGGTLYEPLNLIGDKWSETFFGIETGNSSFSNVYLSSSFSNNDADIKFELLNENGVWENIDLSIYRQSIQPAGSNAVISVINSMLPPTPIEGTPNIRITVKKVRQDYNDRVNKCRFGCLYGVGGALDRIFIAGNPDLKNIDQYSEYNNPFYFPDTNYDEVGAAESAIVGYTVYNSYLTAHKEKSNDGRNAIVRFGSLDSDGNAIFKTVNVLQSPGAVSQCGFGYLGGEPLVATELGIYAITTSELTGERCSQLRSYYIANALLKEDMSDSFAFTHKNFFLLATRDKIFLLDSMQKHYEKDTPNSGFQYECYYFTNLSARILYEENGVLCFGTDDGKLMSFYTDVGSPESYQDNGSAINAYWDIPDISGVSYYKRKLFRRIALRLAAGALTSAVVKAQIKGFWHTIFETSGAARYFDWKYIDFDKFVFTADRTPKTITGKIHIKDVDKVRFRIENSKLNESLGLYSFSLEFSESGNYR